MTTVDTDFTFLLSNAVTLAAETVLAYPTLCSPK